MREANRLAAGATSSESLFEHSGGIEDSDQCHSHIGEDGFPKGCLSGDAKGHEGDFDAQGKDDVLQQDAPVLVSQADGGRIEYARRIVASTKKYLNDLTNLQSAYTRDSRMREAAIVNNEIRRVRSAPGYLESEAFVAEIGPLAETEKPVTLPPGERLAELQPLRRRYEEQLAATESDFSRQQNLWPEKYLQALNQLMMEFQNAGDFSGWESARNEIDRFEMDRLLLPGQLATEPPRLLETQRQHLTLLQGYREARARGIINLAETQIKTLAELQSKYTKAGDMASAGEINAEIRRIRNAPEVQAAQNELNPPPAPETDAPTNAAAHPHT